MRREIKRELKTWVQYFLIALAAEVLSFVAFLPDCDNCAYQVSTLFQHVFSEYEAPRLPVWFTIFTVLSGFRLLSFYLSHKRATQI